jgi:hypothetical protein
VSIIRTDKNVTASALFGVAAIQIIIAAINWFLHGGQFDGFGWFDWLITFSGAIYIALGIAAGWIRLPAAIMGIALYVPFFVLLGSELFAILGVIFLLVAVVSALKHSAAKTRV